MPSPPHSRPRKIVLGTLGAVLVLGVAVWLARDQPRRTVAGLLAGRLAATVRLARLDVLAADRFVLVGLEITRIRDYPSVERLWVAELEVDAALGEIRANRFRRLRLRGVEARLAPSPAVDVPARPLPEIGELILEPAAVHAAGSPAAGDGRLIAEATLFGIGNHLRGRTRLRCEECWIAPWIAVFAPATPPPFAGRFRGLDAELRIAPTGRDARIRAVDARLSGGGHALELTEPRLSAKLESEKTSLLFAAARADLVLAGGVASADAPGLAAEILPPGDDGGSRRFELRPELAWLEGGSVEGAWDSTGRRIERLDARLTGIDLARLLPAVGFDATADLELRGAGDRLGWTATILPRRLRMGPQRELVPGDGSKLVAAGSLPFEPLATLGAPVWDGPLEATLALPAVRGRWNGRRLPPALLPLAARFEGRWQGLEPLSFAGAASLDTAAAGRLEVSGALTFDPQEARTDLSWTWNGGRLDRLAALLHDEGLVTIPFALAGDATAAGSLRGLVARPSLAGEVRLRGVEAGGGPWRLAGAEAAAAWGWAGPGQPLRLRSIAGAGTLEAPNLRPLPLALDAAGWSLADGTRGEVERATVTSPGLGAARVAGVWRRGADRPTEVTGDLIVENLELGRWQDAIEPADAVAALTDFGLAGTAGAELAVAADGAGAWRLSGPVQLAAAGFASADGSRVMEGLTGRWNLAAHGAPSAPIEARAPGTAGGFQLLWNTFFGDFRAVEAGLDVSGRRTPAAAGRPAAWKIEARFDLPEGPTAEATLERPAEADAGLRYSVHVDDRDLAATHRRYLADLLEDRLGSLAPGGNLAARGRGSYRGATGDRPATWSLLGALTLRDFRLTSGGGQAAVAGLHLELPLDLRRRPTPEAGFTGPRLGGRLAFDRLALRGLEVPATATDLLVEADSVGLEQPISLAVLGGRLTFERLTLRRLLRIGRHLEAGLEVADIDLERVARELQLFPLAGALNGRFPLARLSPDRLEVEGGGRMEVFGGVVEVRDISGEDVLTRFPKLTVSAEFRDVDLGALTRRLDFGEMTGVLSGSLEDCELFRGVPVRFSARLQTEKRKGVPRTVDVKAINNITILGTGQGTNVFDRGLQRFFQRYTYSALGVTLRLDDDRLLMRGLEHRGDKELFLRGRLPFRIDVVNAQPGKTVSFQAMVRRLKSLDFTQAKTEP